MERARMSATRQSLVEEVFIPERIQTRGRKEKKYKKWRSTPKPGLKFNILDVTIREVKACNRISVERFNILVNCRVQFFFFHKTLSSRTCSLFF